MKLRKAERKGTPMPILFYGTAGSGKTYSSLLVAKGLASGDMSKVALIDTENNRGAYYCDDDDIGGYNILNVEAPFTPERFVEAIRACGQGGAEVIIIDSISHEWDNVGGVLDLADKGRTQKGATLQGLAKWTKPKLAHKKLIQEIERCKLWVICTCRAKYPMKVDGENFKRADKPVCIQSHDFAYEFLLSAWINKSVAEFDKIPKPLLNTFNNTLDEQTGKSIKEWVMGGADKNEELELLKEKGRKVAENGIDELRSFYTTLNEREKKLLESFFKNDLVAIANYVEDPKEEEEI